jgi:hypothetical protein
LHRDGRPVTTTEKRGRSAEPSFVAAVDAAQGGRPADFVLRVAFKGADEKGRSPVHAQLARAVHRVAGSGGTWKGRLRLGPDGRGQVNSITQIKGGSIVL